VTVFEDNIAYHINMRKCHASPSIPCRSYGQCDAALLRICATFWLFFLELVCLGWMAVATPAIGQISEQTFGPNSKFERCRTIANDTARLRCYEEATPKPAINPSQTSRPRHWHMAAGANAESVWRPRCGLDNGDCRHV
jgi:hypothetical protein